MRTLDQCMQNAKLISTLLNQNFICNSPDIKDLQLSDFLIAILYNKTMKGEIKSFIIKNQILYKVSKQNTHLLCLPSNLCNLIIQTVHIRLGFHFSWRHTVNLLKPLIFHPHLETLIKTQIKSCLVCCMHVRKNLKKFIGNKRSQEHQVAEILIIDSLYMPRSVTGYSKALILVDSGTSKVTIYPSTDLRGATLRRHIRAHLCANPLPRAVISDLGTEMSAELDKMLAKYNIELQCSEAMLKGAQLSRK